MFTIAENFYNLVINKVFYNIDFGLLTINYIGFNLLNNHLPQSGEGIIGMTSACQSVRNTFMSAPLKSF